MNYQSIAPGTETASHQMSDELKSELEEIVLNSSIDLRDYAKHIDSDMRQLEDSLIQKYIATAPDVAKLHHQIKKCDGILEASCPFYLSLQSSQQNMEHVLSNFHDDLGTISSEIQDLQAKSATMSRRLQNRQAVRSSLSQFLSDMAISKQLINNILDAPVTDQEFIESLHELNHKINFCLQQTPSTNDYRSFDEVNDLLKKLKIKAVTKIREYFLLKVQSLRKPMANYQIIQQQLLKYRFFYSFLLTHDREVAVEFRTEYVTIMSRAYYAYFKEYYTKLMKLQLDQSVINRNQNDLLLGQKLDLDSPRPPGAGGNNATTSSTTTTSSPFHLGDRALRVIGSPQTLQSPIILPHVAVKADVKYPIEVLFRSTYYALLDTASREHCFLADFFLLASSNQSESTTTSSNLMTLFDAIMSRTLGWLGKQTEGQLAFASSSHDAIGLLVCLQLLHALLRLAHSRDLPVFDKSWVNLTELLWVRVTDRLDAHIASLGTSSCDVGSFIAAAKSLSASSSSTSSASTHSSSRLPSKAYQLLRPHPLARRYAQLTGALYAVGHSYPGTPLLNDSAPAASRSHAGSTTSSSTNTKTDSATTSGSSNPPSRRHSTTSSSPAPPPLDPRIESRLGRLEERFQAVLGQRLAVAFPRTRLANIFMINNLDLVIGILTEHGQSDCAQAVKCRDLVHQHTSSFIQEALTPYFGSLIGFVKDVEARCESRSGGGGKGKSVDLQQEEARVTHIVRGFNIDWKNSLEKIHSEIINEFANFTLGTRVFQALLTQLVQHYHRFQKLMTSPPYASMPVRNQLVNIHHIMNEVKRFGGVSF